VKNGIQQQAIIRMMTSLRTRYLCSSPMPITGPVITKHATTPYRLQPHSA